ncbi:hypothetical protein OO013_04330 [Mangrovivirga sp. M17]|uniref:Uncharacterized protein n=1 Tax=Mangrovivirga halotolerans TaxID=2993936 RepID=A0ABT3RP89_9BACT|nr:hypothetical protein [Mangrovivirga halotolerans]MCX2743077.1 hypothetical protein [Mangrovivirga halotolerans]
MSKSNDKKSKGRKKEESSEEELLNEIQERNKTRQLALIKIMKKLNSGNK